VTERLSLIAGSGALVTEVLAAARDRDYEIQVLALHRQSGLPRGINSAPIRLADPMGAIQAIRSFGATMVAMAGGVQLSDRDREGFARFLGVPGAVALGDTGLSLLAARLTELTGARLVGVQDIAPEVVAPEGLLGGPEPSSALRDAMAFGLALARKSGDLDLGQGVIVSGQRAIATEDIAGTDALLKRVQTYRAYGLVADGGSPLVLAKAAKPTQPHFVDLPAIGPVTVARARKAGIGAIAVQAGATILIERQKLALAADSARITVFGLPVADA
jgi:DUF1009 family protein